ncbi:dolichyl-P-Man:Man(7)GlcNAc(2)-PP-dolichol alpha-1,6-mannosyltransferase [Gryganskiella cystojenkinii]|nr:dolichyl-P-Man:Man(7)GlcNAc(2)-PP-dolichol alpha-1,6-mannosyltransferase [Gryganskiella cystojenkinii]
MATSEMEEQAKEQNNSKHSNGNGINHNIQTNGQQQGNSTAPNVHTSSSNGFAAPSNGIIKRTTSTSSSAKGSVRFHSSVTTTSFTSLSSDKPNFKTERVAISSSTAVSSISSSSYTTTDYLIQGTVLTLIAAHILIAPFTKVEESFNLQATHDILTLGVSRESVAKYDHLEFPGVVPRTFVGPLLLAIGSWPVMTMVSFFSPSTGVPKSITGQIIVRLVLGLFTFFGWHQLSQGIRHQFGRTVSRLFMIVSAVQFHWLFYAGRTLPNTFALTIVNLAFSYWMQASTPATRSITKRETEERLMRMLDCLVVATVLFRSEILLLMGPILLLELSTSRIRFWRMIQEGIVAGVASLSIAVAVDSWFWQQWIWAEGAVFWYNAVEGKSVAWGVSPWHTYFTSLLPKISGVALPLALIAGIVGAIDVRYRRYLVPATAFVSIYSFLGHKEWRFIVYVVPILNLGAALTISWVMKRKTVVYRLLMLVIVAALGVNLASSIAQSLISSTNYPGGHALQRLHELELSNFSAAHVHIDGAAAETGCSRFGERPADPFADPEMLHHWTYSKEEKHTTPDQYLQYTHLLTADPDFHRERFLVLEQVDGYAGISKASMGQLKKTCRPTEVLASGKNKDLKTIVTSVWLACSPVQIKKEGRIWIMKQAWGY